MRPIRDSVEWLRMASQAAVVRPSVAIRPEEGVAVHNLTANAPTEKAAVVFLMP